MIGIIKRVDGGISICSRAIKDDDDKVLKPYAGCTWANIPKEDVLADRSDRDAWEFDETEKKIKVNAVKKQVIDTAKQDVIDRKEALNTLVTEKVAITKEATK